MHHVAGIPETVYDRPDLHNSKTRLVALGFPLSRICIQLLLLSCCMFRLCTQFQGWAVGAGHPDWGKLAREVVAIVGKSGDCKEIVCPMWVSPHTGVIFEPLACANALDPQKRGYHRS